MDWQIAISPRAQKFLDREHLSDEFVFEPIRSAAKRLSGEDVPIDLKKLSGKWKGFYRVRKGKLRIIFSINVRVRYSYIDTVDYRGGAYR